MKRVLRALDVNNRRRRLIGVAIPNRRPEITHRSRIRQCGGCRRHHVQAADQVEHLIHFSIHKPRQATRQETQKGLQWQWCGYKEDLAQRAVKPTNDGAGCRKETERLERWKSRSRPNDNAGIRLRRRGPQQACQYTRYPHPVFHGSALLLTRRLLSLTARCLASVLSIKFSLPALPKNHSGAWTSTVTLHSHTPKHNSLKWIP